MALYVAPVRNIVCRATGSDNRLNFGENILHFHKIIDVGAFGERTKELNNKKKSTSSRLRLNALQKGILCLSVS